MHHDVGLHLSAGSKHFEPIQDPLSSQHPSIIIICGIHNPIVRRCCSRYPPFSVLDQMILPGCFPLQRAVSAAYGRRQFISTAASTCVPVVIAGAGPTGLVLSSLLSQYGATAGERSQHRAFLQAENFHNSCQLYGVCVQAFSTCCWTRTRASPSTLRRTTSTTEPWRQVAGAVACSGMAAVTSCLPTPSQRPPATLHGLQGLARCTTARCTPQAQAQACVRVHTCRCFVASPACPIRCRP